MFQPIPGCAHLLRFVPEDPIAYTAPTSTMQQQQMQTVSRLVAIVIEVAAGRRQLKQLESFHFAPQIHTHIEAWLAQPEKAEPRGRVALLSLHGRQDGEFFGTALLNSTQHAFTGRCENNRLEAFRIL